MDLPTISEMMTPHPVCVNQAAPLGECARALVRHHVRHLPTVGDDGRLLGVVSDFDVLGRGTLVGAFEHLWLAFDPGEESLTARDIMGSADVVARRDDVLGSILRRMVTSKQDTAVVLEEGRPIGLFTEHDAVHLAANLLDDTIHCDDVAAKPVISVDRHDDAIAALERMRAEFIRHMIVTDDGRLYGVLSFRDVVRDRVPDGIRWEAQDAVRRVPPLAVDAGASLKYAARLMYRQRIGCLPVVGDDAIPTGVLTRTDVIRALVA